MILLLVISTSASASDGDGVRMQGLVMAVDLKTNTLTVNERIFVLNPSTILQNHKGLSIPMDKLKPKMWVYIEGVDDHVNHRVKVNKLYLLPKYVEKKERYLYPFIK